MLWKDVMVTAVDDVARRGTEKLTVPAATVAVDAAMVVAAITGSMTV